MKNKFYKYFFQEFLSLLTLIILSLTCIMWTIQAVNYLDLVTEDGHSFALYFSYSVFGIPKIFVRLLPFSFLVALIITIVKFEKDNELIILWTSGINKLKIVHLILLISISISLFQLLIGSIISPQALFISRGFLKSSELSFFPTLVKEKKFNDTVEGLTIFIESKKNNELKNIFLRDDSSPEDSSTIIAKSGSIIKKGNSNILILYNGIIQKEKVKHLSQSKTKINTINFSKTEINLSKYTTKTVTHPKIQERSSLALIGCLAKHGEFFSSYFHLKNLLSDKCSYWADEENKRKIIIEYFNELNRRFILPFYIPLVALICCYLLSSKKEGKNFLLKYSCFLLGILILIFAEICMRSSTNSRILLYSFYVFPIIFGLLNYLILLKIFKFENLKK